MKAERIADVVTVTLDAEEAADLAKEADVALYAAGTMDEECLLLEELAAGLEEVVAQSDEERGRRVERNGEA